MDWFGISLAFILLLIIGKRSLWVGLFIAAIVLGCVYLQQSQMVNVVLRTLTDPSILLLAVAVGLIPIIGGAMEQSGLMGDLVDNLRIGKKPFLAFGPALVGMLPIAAFIFSFIFVK
ncbi:MAG: hypothetical protein WBB86_01150 [Candidatus Omnitrophota bacterium]